MGEGPQPPSQNSQTRRLTLVFGVTRRVGASESPGPGSRGAAPKRSETTQDRSCRGAALQTSRPPPFNKFVTELHSCLLTRPPMGPVKNPVRRGSLYLDRGSKELGAARLRRAD